MGRSRSATRVSGSRRNAGRAGGKPFWDDPWFTEWDSFRRHVVALHYDELAGWVHAMGIPRDRIYSAQAFIAPDAGMRPVALHIRGPSPDYDSAGVSIEGSIPARVTWERSCTVRPPRIGTR